MKIFCCLILNYYKFSVLKFIFIYIQFHMLYSGTFRFCVLSLSSQIQFCPLGWRTKANKILFEPYFNDFHCIYVWCSVPLHSVGGSNTPEVKNRLLILYPKKSDVLETAVDTDHSV